MLDRVKVKSVSCGLCGSNETSTFAKFIDGQYKLNVECLNKDCISNKIKNGNNNNL